MSRVVKIKASYSISDESWVETYTMIEELRHISEQLDEEEITELNNQIARLREVSMQILDTNNFVAFAEIDGNDDSFALVELDYLYTGENIVVTNFFEEDGDYFVTIEVID